MIVAAALVPLADAWISEAGSQVTSVAGKVKSAKFNSLMVEKRHVSSPRLGEGSLDQVIKADSRDAVLHGVLLWLQ